MKWHQLLAHSQCLLNIWSHGHNMLEMYYLQCMCRHCLSTRSRISSTPIKGKFMDIYNTSSNTVAFKKSNFEKSTPKRPLWSASRLQPAFDSFFITKHNTFQTKWATRHSQAHFRWIFTTRRNSPRVNSGELTGPRCGHSHSLRFHSHQKRRMSKINSQREHDLWPLTSHLCVSVTSPMMDNV